MINKSEQQIDILLTELANMCQSPKDADTVGKLITRQHRTHQQSIGRFIQAVVKVFSSAYDNHHYDLRNEATCKMCSNIKEQVEGHVLPFI